MKNANLCWPLPENQNKCSAMLNKPKLKYIITVATLLVNLALVNSAVFAEEIPPIDCMIEPNIMVEISSPVAGVLDTITVDRSDEVKKGQVIATIKSDVEQVDVKISQEQLKLSKDIYTRSLELYRKKVITITEKDKSDNDKKISELNLQHAEANLRLRQIKSPIDGVVVKRHFSPGEFVESEPIIKLAQLDPLKIEVVSLVSNYGKIVKGMLARISPEFGDYQNLIAEVVVVDKVIDAASGTFGVRLELANKDHKIPSGLKCKVHFMSIKAGSAKSGMNNEKPVSESSVQTTVTETIADAESVSSTSAFIDKPLMCSSIGPYKNQAELNKLMVSLEADIQADMKRTDLRTETEVKTTYLVVSDKFDTLQASKVGMQKMKAAGVSDIAMINKNGKHLIALGLYSQKVSAIHRVKALQKKGYKAQITPKQKELKTYWADIVYSPASDKTITKIIPERYKKTCDESINLSLLNNEQNSTAMD